MYSISPFYTNIYITKQIMLNIILDASKKWAKLLIFKNNNNNKMELKKIKTINIQLLLLFSKYTSSFLFFSLKNTGMHWVHYLKDAFKNEQNFLKGKLSS